MSRAPGPYSPRPPDPPPGHLQGIMVMGPGHARVWCSCGWKLLVEPDDGLGARRLAEQAFAEHRAAAA